MGEWAVTSEMIFLRSLMFATSFLRGFVCLLHSSLAAAVTRSPIIATLNSQSRSTNWPCIMQIFTSTRSTSDSTTGKGLSKLRSIVTQSSTDPVVSTV